MTGVAHISFAGGGLVVPTRTPYERELLFQHVEGAAKRHGPIQLEVDHQHWTVSPSTEHRQACARCLRRLRSLTFRFDGRSLCAQCARGILH